MEYIVRHLDHTDPRIKKIAIHYGYDRQSIKLIEEMAELQQAICKNRESKDKVKTLIDIKKWDGRCLHSIGPDEIPIKYQRWRTWRNKGL